MLITDAASTEELVDRTRAALGAAPPGRVAVQARAKGASARALAELASALLPVCRAAGAPLLVNDRADVARAIGADGVHLPERGLSVAQARAVLGQAIVGRSCHARGGLDDAQRQGADYALLAPVEAVPGKGRPLGVQGFRDAVRGLELPVFALGGIEPAAVPRLRAAGAAGVAASRGVYRAAPAAAVGALLAALALPPEAPAGVLGE